MLGKLEGDRSLAELIQALTQDLCLEYCELAILADANTENIAQWARDYNTPNLGRLNDLGAIAALLIRDGGMRPREVGGWFRSRNTDLSLACPLDALRQQGFLPVHRAAEAACEALSTHEPTEAQ